MGGFFNIDNPLMKGLSKIYDLIILSLLWTVCCIPIVTIGPATTALYYTVVKTIRRDRGYVTKEFFKSFLQNMKVGILTNLLLLLFTVILLVNLNYAKNMEGAMGGYLWYIYLVFGVLLIMISMYVYPILSRFTVNVKDLLRMSLFASVRHFPITLYAVAVFAVFVALVYLTALMGIVIAPGLCALTTSFLMEKVLKKYTPEQNTGEDGEDPEHRVDTWYLE